MPVKEPLYDMYLQHYSYSFIFIGEHDDVTKMDLVYVKSVTKINGSKNNVKIHGDVWDGYERIETFKEFVFPGNKIIVKQPTGGFYNVNDKYVQYWSRIPERQWRRGFSVDSWRVTTPNKEELATYGKPPMIKGRVAPTTLVPKYYSPKEALESVISGDCLSAAINNRYCVIVKKGMRVPFLMYKTKYVGWFDHNGILNLPETVKCLIEDVSQYWEYKYAYKDG